jgi:Mn-containing catalase
MDTASSSAGLAVSRSFTVPAPGESYVRSQQAPAYAVRVTAPNPGLANLLLEQFGGPQGELAAACRYFTQAVGEDDPGRKDMLFDIATEELSRLEIIGCIVSHAEQGSEGPARRSGCGDGRATVGVSEADVEVLQATASRTASNPNADPKTGANLGSGEASW